MIWTVDNDKKSRQWGKKKSYTLEINTSFVMVNKNRINIQR